MRIILPVSCGIVRIKLVNPCEILRECPALKRCCVFALLLLFCLLSRKYMFLDYGGKRNLLFSVSNKYI